MKSVQAILFDKDGTLIDFNKTWLPIYKKTAEYLASVAGQPERAAEMLAAGGYVKEDDSWQPDSLLASGSNAQIYEFWEEQLGINISGKHYQWCQEAFRLKDEGYAPVLEDLPKFLNELRNRGLVLGVATMDDECSARETLAGLGCLECFEFVCGADSGFGVKPESGMLNGFSQSTGISAEYTVMVGDSPRDLIMGRNAGAGLCVGVLTGTTSAVHLWPNADYVFDNVAGLRTLV